MSDVSRVEPPAEHHALGPGDSGGPREMLRIVAAEWKVENTGDIAASA
jgi:hypothetical protein